MSSSRCLTGLMVPIALAGLTLRAGGASAEPQRKGLDKLPLSLQTVTGLTAPHLPSSTQWGGREYDIESGIEVLMEVGRKPEMSVKDRELALIQLTVLRTHLNGHPCLDELKTRFADAGKLEKKIILTCFKGARDIRAIPLFVRVLDNEQDLKLRLSAAVGLGGWNIRRGVAELVVLLESKEILPQPARMPYVRDNALESFHSSNARKGWGFADEEVRKSLERQVVGFDREEFKKRWELGDEQTRKSLEARAQAPREEFLALYVAEIKKWFEANKERFPDWKPGDPLPETSKPESKESRGE